ncbi:hypothetical protein COY95_01605, partial [Candidatus Woesearchaeota archaeon CG_4_10_14_0_8_um_filter_47_5]
MVTARKTLYDSGYKPKISLNQTFFLSVFRVKWINREALNGETLVKLSFDNLRFYENKDESKDENKGSIRLVLLQYFACDIPRTELETLGNVSVEENALVVESASKNLRERFLWIMEKHLPLLTNVLTQRKAVYIHKNSGIPLIGSLSFGLVDRNNTIIELKPMTGCNLRCIYCSIAEGSPKKSVDYVVEKEYLVDELRTLA